MWKTFKQIGSVGIITEAPPAPADELRVREQLQAQILATLGRALCIRQVDAGSCNGCELEIHALNNAFYNVEGLGVRFVARSEERRVGKECRSRRSPRYSRAMVV